jgi:ornithine carbamoyltransferase
VYWGIAAAARVMGDEGGSIINIASAGGDIPAPTLSAHGMMKAGVMHLTKTAAAELGPHLIRVNAIAPGFIETERRRVHGLRPVRATGRRSSRPGWDLWPYRDRRTRAHPDHEGSRTVVPDRAPASPTEDVAMKDMLRIADLTPESLHDLLDLAKRFKEAPHRRADAFERQTVVLHFARPSTRAKLSFETAVTRLGGHPVVIGPDELQLASIEAIDDTARLISRYAAALVVRTPSHHDVERLAEIASIPVVNAATARHHPCQALADLLTLRERFGGLDGVKVAYVGDGTNVADSLIEACATTGLAIAVATPPGYEPDRDIVNAACHRAALVGGSVTMTGDPHEAVEGADAVYTGTWFPTGISDAEREARCRAFEPYRVDRHLMARAAADAVFLHCLPAHRGDEVAPDVMNGHRSLVFDQAANRLPTAMAVLDALTTGRLVEAASAGDVVAARW